MSSCHIFQGIQYDEDRASTNVIQILILMYVIIACVMMLNMLIAMLNNTYERIHENCDIEWKYARSELLKVKWLASIYRAVVIEIFCSTVSGKFTAAPFQEYRNGQPFIFPFHVILLPVTAWFRHSVRYVHQQLIIYFVYAPPQSYQHMFILSISSACLLGLRRRRSARQTLGLTRTGE